MRDVGDGLDIDEGQGGVAGGFDPHQLGVRVMLEKRAQVDLNVAGEGGGDAVGGRNLGEVAVGAAVDIGDRDDVGASGERLQGGSHSGQTGRKGERILSVLERRDRMLKVVAVGVRAASVLVVSDGASEGSLSIGGRERDLLSCQLGGLERDGWGRVSHTASMTAPVAGSWGEPAWTARVPKPRKSLSKRGTTSEGGVMGRTVIAIFLRVAAEAGVVAVRSGIVGDWVEK